MGKPEEDYVWIVVESYRPSSTAGKHGPIHVRPAAGQGYDQKLQSAAPERWSETIASVHASRSARN
jgi:hypothetical protein